MIHAASFCRLSAGAFFLVGLACGVWKYVAIHRSPEGKAPHYVDIAHRSALLYAFACGLMADLAQGSTWSNAVNLGASLAAITFFVLAVAGYVVHGALDDTDNQLRKPHRLGKGTLPEGAILTFMVLLIFGECAGVATLCLGYACNLH